MALVLVRADTAADVAATAGDAAFDAIGSEEDENAFYSSITVRYRVAIGVVRLPSIVGNARPGNPERREVTRSRRRPPLLKIQGPLRCDSS